MPFAMYTSDFTVHFSQFCGTAVPFCVSDVLRREGFELYNSRTLNRKAKRVRIKKILKDLDIRPFFESKSWAGRITIGGDLVPVALNGQGGDQTLLWPRARGHKNGKTLCFDSSRGRANSVLPEFGTWLQTGFPGQLKLVSRFFQIPNLHTVGCGGLEGREFSPAAIGRSAHMPNTCGKQLEPSTGEHICAIVTMMQFASSSSQLSINRECSFEREYRD